MGVFLIGGILEKMLEATTGFRVWVNGLQAGAELFLAGDLEGEPYTNQDPTLEISGPS